MNKINQAFSYLKKDILKNCDLITFLQIYDDIKFVYVDNDGVCFQVCSKDITCISSDNIFIAEKIVNSINNVQNCICKNHWDFEVFNKKFNFKGVDECFQYVYSREENFKPIKNIRLLSKDDIFELKNNFSIEISTEEIEKLMQKFNFYGYILYGKIVGVVGRHIDGEIGFLEVLTDYRNRGIATELTKTIVNENSNITPYSQVVIDNIKSINLQKKLGAIQNPTTVFWCYNDNY